VRDVNTRSSSSVRRWASTTNWGGCGPGGGGGGVALFEDSRTTQAVHVRSVALASLPATLHRASMTHARPRSVYAGEEPQTVGRRSHLTPRHRRDVNVAPLRRARGVWHMRWLMTDHLGC
jgi:hypothetical protein